MKCTDRSSLSPSVISYTALANAEAKGMTLSQILDMSQQAQTNCCAKGKGKKLADSSILTEFEAFIAEIEALIAAFVPAI